MATQMKKQQARKAFGKRNIEALTALKREAKAISTDLAQGRISQQEYDRLSQTAKTHYESDIKESKRMYDADMMHSDMMEADTPSQRNSQLSNRGVRITPRTPRLRK